MAGAANANKPETPSTPPPPHAHHATGVPSDPVASVASSSTNPPLFDRILTAAFSTLIAFLLACRFLLLAEETQPKALPPPPPRQPQVKGRGEEDKKEGWPDSEGRAEIGRGVPGGGPAGGDSITGSHYEGPPLSLTPEACAEALPRPRPLPSPNPNSSPSPPPPFPFPRPSNSPPSPPHRPVPAASTSLQRPLNLPPRASAPMDDAITTEPDFLFDSSDSEDERGGGGLVSGPLPAYLDTITEEDTDDLPSSSSQLTSPASSTRSAKSRIPLPLPAKRPRPAEDAASPLTSPELKPQPPALQVSSHSLYCLERWALLS